jgi:hypothetical protein
MEKIDRLGWADGLSFTAYGVRVGVRVNDAQFMKRLQEYLPPGWKPASPLVVERLYSLILNDGEKRQRGVRPFNLLYGNMTKLARALSADEVLETFESDLQLHVAEGARRKVFVHAGVVGWRGRAVLIPGYSLSGKTSLVAELVRNGATYYSDEYAVLDLRGRVHPYPKPLQIREGESARQKKYPVEAFGGRAGVKPLPVGLIVASKYRAGAQWRPRILSAGRGTLELLAHTVSARRQPELALGALQRVAAHAPVLKCLRGEANHTAELILRYLDNLKERA